MGTAWGQPGGPIGVDIGASRLKVAQVAQGRRGWRVTAFGSLPRAEHTPVPSAEEIERLGSMLDRMGFVGNRVVLGAPRSMLKAAVLDLPPKSSGAPIDQLCGAELARMFRLAPGSYEMDAWEMPSATERSRATQMAATAMLSDDAEQLIAPFEAIGLQVEAIDLGGQATCRACRSACAEGDDLTALLDLGWHGVGMGVFRGGEAVYERWLPGVGTAGLADSIGRSLGFEERAAGMLIRRVGLAGLADPDADPVVTARLQSIVREYAESLLQHVLASVSYVLDRFPGESVGHVRLVGGGAGMPQLAPYLAELSGLDIRAMAPSEVGFGNCRGVLDGSMLTALGHAMWRAA